MTVVSAGQKRSSAVQLTRQATPARKETPMNGEMFNRDPEIRRIDDLLAAESRRVDGLLKGQDAAVALALAASEKASASKLFDLERRLEGMNEFRAQLSMQAGTFLTVERFEREHKLLADRMESQQRDLMGRLSAEERVTARQDSAAAAVEGIRSNNRWLIGIALGLAGTLGVTLLHITGIVE